MSHFDHPSQAACGVIGSFLAAALVQWGKGGRKFAMAFFTIVAGVRPHVTGCLSADAPLTRALRAQLFLFGLTLARNARTINALTCMAALFENAFYGVCVCFLPFFLVH
jgi:hypothetical protein